MVIAVLLGLSGALLVPALKRHLTRLAPDSFEQALARREARRGTAPREVEQTEAVPVGQSLPLLLWLPRTLGGSGRAEALRERVSAAVEAFQERSGVPLPVVRFRWHEGGESGWRLDAFDVPIASGEWSGGASETAMIAAIDEALAANATEFLGMQEAGQLLSMANVDYPDIVKETVRLVPIQHIAQIFRNLVDERLPIRNLRAILEALIEGAPHEKHPGGLTDYARLALARHTCHRLAPDGVMRVIALGAPLEEQLTSALRSSGGVHQLSLDPVLQGRVRDALVGAVDAHAPAALVASGPLRRHVRALLPPRYRAVPVLAYAELVGGVQLDVAEQITLEGTVPLAAVR